MTFEMSDILRSKHEYRLRLAALPIAEKLRLLDELRRRSVLLAASQPSVPQSHASELERS